MLQTTILQQEGNLKLNDLKSVQKAPNGAEMIMVDVSQRSNEWHEWRSQGVTASDIPVILGLSPYKTKWQLWAEKIGRINTPDISNNPNVRRGNRLEDKARQLAEQRYGEILLPVCGEYLDWNVLRASFDGLNSEHNSFEFKAPSESVWNDIVENGEESATYKLYEAQTQTQCIVSGSTEGRLIFYREDGDDWDFEVKLSQERIEHIVNEAKAFWELVETRTPPEADPLKDWYIPELGDDSFRWQATTDAWRTQNHRVKALKENLKDLETELKGFQKEMIAQMGPFMQADVGGVKVSRYEKRGSIDYQAFLKDKFPDKDFDKELESYRKASREESRFSKSEDELVNPEVGEVITSVKAAYF
jgi:putative phage-type endonuclease